MNNSNKNIIKKVEQSTSEFKGQVFEMLLGLAIALIGAILFFATTFMPLAALIVIGVYLLFSGASGFLSYGIFAFLEKGRYIAFTNEEVIIHSPIPKKCKNIAFSSISSVAENKSLSFDIFGKIWLKKTKTASVIINYTNEKGKSASELFGGIDNCSEFISALNEAMKSAKN